MERGREQRIDFKRTLYHRTLNVRDFASKYEATGQTRDEISPRTKVVFESFDRSPDICSPPPRISPSFYRIEPIELDRLRDREGGASGFSPKLGMSLPLQTWPTFTLPLLIEFHDISTNFPGVYRGICEAKIVETVWKWPSISPLATWNIEIRVSRERRKFCCS